MTQLSDVFIDWITFDIHWKNVPVIMLKQCFCDSLRDSPWALQKSKVCSLGKTVLMFHLCGGYAYFKVLWNQNIHVVMQY